MVECEKSLILFDFDGTIVDGDIAFTMLENTLTEEEYKSVTDLIKWIMRNLWKNIII